MSLLDFTMEVYADKKLAWLAAELTVATAKKLEQVLDDACIGLNDDYDVTQSDQLPDASNYQRNVILNRYMVVAHAAVASSGTSFISLATDAARVGRRNMLSTAIVLPSNKAIWAPPQVWFKDMCL
jgi:hypothetical protein